MDARVRDVVWTQRAREAVEEALAYVAEDSAAAASKLLDKVLVKAASLDRFSARGRVVPELAVPAVRELFVHDYRLIYEVTGSAVTIVAFLHGARDFETWRRSEGPL